MTWATRSTRPRSPTGDAVRSAWPRPQAVPARSGDTQTPAKDFKHTVITIEVNVNMSNEMKCPFSGTQPKGPSNRDWWPNQLNLKPLQPAHPTSDPMGKEFNYAEEFKTLDLAALKKDIEAVMTTS